MGCNNQILFGQIKKNEMGRTCSTSGGEERYIQDFGGETCSKETTWKARRGWEYSIETDLQEAGWRGMDWIDLRRVRDRWRAVVNAVMNLMVP